MSRQGPLGAAALLTSIGPRSDVSRWQPALSLAMSAWRKHESAGATWAVCLHVFCMPAASIRWQPALLQQRTSGTLPPTMICQHASFRQCICHHQPPGSCFFGGVALRHSQRGQHSKHERPWARASLPYFSPTRQNGNAKLCNPVPSFHTLMAMLQATRAAVSSPSAPAPMAPLPSSSCSTAPSRCGAWPRWSGGVCSRSGGTETLRACTVAV